MLRNIHSRGAILILSLFLFGCNDDGVINSEKFKEELDKDFERPKIDEPKDHKAPSSKINDLWYTKVDITITKEVPMVDMIKSIASKLGLKIVFNVKDPIGVNYVAKNKPFLEVLEDLAEMQAWKIKINALNAKISVDAPYFQIYSIPFLMGIRNNASETSFSGKSGAGGGTGASDGATNFGGVNLGSQATLSTTAQLDVFQELKRNLEILFPATEGEEVVKFSIHQQGGVLSVIATQKNHRMLARYINTLAKKISNQILVEARIYEIELLESYETGVDWGRIMSYPLLKYGAPIQSAGMFSLELVSKPAQSFSELSGSIAKYLREFGKVNSVSNPRMLIANNNTGIFKAVENQVFFKMRKETSAITVGKDDNRRGKDELTTMQIFSDIQTVPIGTIILVQPSICDDGRITIALRPTITEVHGTIEDPAVKLMAKGIDDKIKSEIPIVKTRELDTVFTTEEGRVVIIGGLLYSTKEDKESGLPFSWFGGHKKKLSKKKEVVIVIKATKESFDGNLYDIIYLG